MLLGLLILGACRPLDAQLCATAFALTSLDAVDGLFGFFIRAKVNESILIPHDGALEDVTVQIEELFHFVLVHFFGKIGHVECGADFFGGGVHVGL
jgi:hypothetical protein